MPLSAGTRFGPYEVVAPLGAGGMGEVYRARDTRLGRDVALKVLPQNRSASPDVRARFEREARTISALNHPHICALYDVGREGDADYLVLELVEGETLADRIARGALPATETLRIGAQIADALDRAHRAGVVHRDLKPGNVMLTRAGAKLMDFGLARAGPAGGAGAATGALSASPTVAQPLTAEGAILGTFQYMAPEQLEGREADARADLWALGCVLYEMATGRRAFEARSQASLIAAIMHESPRPPSQISPLAPPALDRLVSTCLAKDPADRVQSAHDVRLQLEWLADGASPAPAAPAAVASRRPRWLAYAGVAAATAAVTALALVTAWRREPDRGGLAERYILGRAELQIQSAPALAPDGTYVVFSVREGTTRRIWRRNLASFESAPIPGTEDGAAPFFSPDGAWMGFSTPEALKKVPAAGGAPQLVAAEPRVSTADWGNDGTIWFTPRAGGRDGLTALARVPHTGGRVEVVATLDTTAGETEAWLPEVLPDGRTVVVTFVQRGGARWSLAAIRPGGERTPLVENALLGRYSPSGHLLYFDFESRAVLAAPFDPATLRIEGPALPLTEAVDPSYCFDAGARGKLVYVPVAGAGDGRSVVWVDGRGETRPVMDTRARWTQPRVSPDGRRILVRKSGVSCEIWTYDTASGALARLLQGGDFHSPVWSPDGRWIAVTRAEEDRRLVAIRMDGAREEITLATGAAAGEPSSWGGSDLIAYTVEGRATRNDVWVRRFAPGAQPEPFVAGPASESDPAVHPAGGWIAYVSHETGMPEVFVRRHPDTGEMWQASSGGGASPLWARDGRALYWLAGETLMRAAVQTTPAFRVGTPGVLFEGGLSVARTHDFDLAPDGRFVSVGGTAEDAAGTEIRLLVHWERELERMRAPVAPH